MDNVRSISNGLTPEQILEKAREFKPRYLIVSFLDDTGTQTTLHSDMNAAHLAFLTLSTHAQVSKFLAGG